MANNVFSLEEVFEGKYFIVPDYQRGYAWEKENCLELLDDLDLLPDSFNHYTGTLVIHPRGEIKRNKAGKSIAGYDIVDGQQRLTSLVILLDSIRKEFSANKNYIELSSGIENSYIATCRLEDGAKLYKLTLNNDCSEFFKNNILGTPILAGAIIRSHERLQIAKTTFKEYFQTSKSELGEDYINWLLKLYDKVVQRLRFGIYFVDSAAEVGVIFEVMNNRGKPLTELEKVKNYLLYLTTKLTIKTADELALKINKTWSNIYERFMQAGLGDDGENQFLRAHWLMAYDYKKSEWDGSKSIKSKFNLKLYREKHLELLNDLLVYVSTLDDASIAFADLEQPDRESAFNIFSNSSERNKVRDISTKLKRTRTIASFRPLLMSCRLCYPSDYEKYFTITSLIEKFAFRVYNLEGNRSNTGQSFLYRLAYQLYHKEIAFDEAMNQIITLLAKYSIDSNFNAIWEFNELDNDWYHWGPLKYLLYEYEEFLNNGRPCQMPWDTFVGKELENSIEHILPQTPDDQYWISHFTAAEIAIYLHDLGNLCITYDNGSYYNKDFIKKKGAVTSDNPCYAKSILTQERELIKYTDWTVVSIKDRRAKITQWAKDRWYVDLTSNPGLIEDYEDSNDDEK